MKKNEYYYCIRKICILKNIMFNYFFYKRSCMMKLEEYKISKIFK